MNAYIKWATVGIAWSIVGILAGCGSIPAFSTTSNQAVTNTATNKDVNIASNATAKSVTNAATGSSTPPAASTGGTWKTYTNDRFGFSVEYPSTWKMGPRPNDGDGRYFTTPSGLASFDNGYSSGVAKSDVLLLAVGTANVVNGSGNGYNFNQMVAQFKKNLPNERKQQGFVSESYTVVPNKWVVDTVVTKLEQGGVQYREMYTNLDTNQTSTMIFPESELKVYLPIWNDVSKKFQPGNKPG